MGVIYVVIYVIDRYIYHGFYKKGGSIQSVDVSGVLNIQISGLFGVKSEERDAKANGAAGNKDFEENLLSTSGHISSEPLPNSDMPTTQVIILLIVMID